MGDLVTFQGQWLAGSPLVEKVGAQFEKGKSQVGVENVTISS